LRVKSRVMTSSVIASNFLVSASKSGKVSTGKVMREQDQYLYRPIEHPARQGIIALDDCSQVHGELLVSLTVISTWPGPEPFYPPGSDRITVWEQIEIKTSFRLCVVPRAPWRTRGILKHSRSPEKIPDMESFTVSTRFGRDSCLLVRKWQPCHLRMPRRIRRYLEKSVVIRGLSCEERRFGKGSTTNH